MSFTRRSLLIGAGSGLSLLALGACTDAPPSPSFSPSPSNPVPNPSSILRSSWASDPFSRGALSYLPVGATPQDRETLRQPLLERVFFAGEATSDEPATVRGARSSGIRASSELAAIAASGERIAVIGAGIAGAECARQLAVRGLNVVVLEARDRTGGRIETIAATDTAAAAQLGAWSFGEGSDAGVLAELDRLGVQSRPLSSPSLLRASSSPTEATIEAGAEPVPRGATAVAEAIAWAGLQPRDSSLSTALKESGAADTASQGSGNGFEGSALLEQYLRRLSVSTGAEPQQLSAWFAPPPATEPQRLVTGPLVSLVDELLQNIEVSLSTVVVGISYDESQVSLRLATGESLSVDRVVVTVPLGVLQNGGIQFSPLLPFTQRAAINSLGVGDVEVVRVSFDSPFWTTDAVNWSLVGSADALSTWVNLQPITGENTLLALVGADAAVALTALDDAQLRELIRSSLWPFAETAAAG